MRKREKPGVGVSVVYQIAHTMLRIFEPHTPFISFTLLFVIDYFWLLPILICQKVTTEAYNPEAYNFPLYVQNQARVF